MSRKLKAGQTITEPVTLQELKTWLKVTTDTENDLITQLGVTAREYLEQLTDQVFTERTILAYFDSFPLLDNYLEIKVYPISSVTHIKYLAETETDLNNLTPWDPAKYRIDLVSRYARIAPINTESFPNTLSELNAIEIEFIAGYALNGAADNIPKRFKDAIKLLVAEMFENRENRVNKLPTTVMNLLKRDMDFNFQ